MNATFQLMLSTDGRASFATPIFKDPPELFSSLASNSFVGIGFDGGSQDTGMAADVREFLISNGLEVPPVSTYRIDGR